MAITINVPSLSLSLSVCISFRLKPSETCCQVTTSWLQILVSPELGDPKLCLQVQKSRNGDTQTDGIEGPPRLIQMQIP